MTSSIDRAAGLLSQFTERENRDAIFGLVPMLSDVDFAKLGRFSRGWTKALKQGAGSSESSQSTEDIARTALAQQQHNLLLAPLVRIADMVDTHGPDWGAIADEIRSEAKVRQSWGILLTPA